MTQFYDMPDRDAVLQYSLVRRSFTTYQGRNAVFISCPGRDAVIQHVLGTTQYYDMPGRNTVLWHTLVGTQFYDMPRSRRNLTTCPGLDAVFTTCPGRDAVLRHALVGMQF